MSERDGAKHTTAVKGRLQMSRSSSLAVVHRHFRLPTLLDDVAPSGLVAPPSESAGNQIRLRTNLYLTLSNETHLPASQSRPFNKLFAGLTHYRISHSVIILQQCALLIFSD